MRGMKARTGSALRDATDSALGSSHEGYERQVTTMSGELDVQFERNARLAFYEGLGLSAWPAGSTFESRGEASTRAPKVDFVGSRALQGAMRPMFVVPANKELKLAQERRARQGDYRQDPNAAIFHRFYETFDNRDAARLADGALAMTDVVPLTPGLEGSADKLHAAVVDQVFGRHKKKAGFSHRPC